MGSARHWVYASRAAAARVRDSFDHREGLPRKSEPVTGGDHVDIPDRYVLGAPGWSAHLLDIDVNAGQYAIQRVIAATSRHEGNTVRHPTHGDVVLPTEASSVVRGSEWDPGPAGVAVTPPKVRPSKR